MKPDFFIARAIRVKLEKYFSYTITFRLKDTLLFWAINPILRITDFKFPLLRTPIRWSRGRPHIKKLYLPTKILKPEDCSWCEHFPPPPLEKLRMLLLLLLLLLLLFLFLSVMILIIGFTCPPTIHFKFITKCDNFITKYDRNYKVRQNIR